MNVFSDLGTPAEEGKKVAKAAGLLGVLTFASRILGLARDVAQAAILGTGMAADAFTIAFIIPNILRRLFGEATVASALVPTYTETLLREGKREAGKLAGKIITFAGTLLLLIVLVGVLFSPLLVKLFAPGFENEPGKALLTIQLLRTLFPYILFVGTASILMGILNSHRHFLAPALAPILFNISALSGLFLLAGIWRTTTPVWGYAVGVLIGGALQLLVQIPFMKSKGVSFKPDFDWNDPRLKRVLKLALPALVGLLAAEVNILVDQLIASFLSEGSVAALSYGLRITQVPQGVFAVALATALLPTLSRQTALGRLDEAGRTLGLSTLVISGIMLPASLYLVVMAEPVVRVMFFRGEFSGSSLRLTAAALRYYSAGMVFYSAVKITAPVFYALKDTQTPVKIAIGCMGLNIILNAAFTLFFIKTGIAEPLAGLALASSVASFVNLALLKRKLRGRVGRAGIPARAWAALVLSNALATVFLFLLKPHVSLFIEAGFLRGVVSVVLSGLLVMAFSTGLFFATGGEQVRHIMRKVANRGR